jgi:signal peptidase I
MEPTLHDGEIVVVRGQDSYSVGDIIAFRVPAGQPLAGGTVIHRIVGGTSATGFVLKGDSRTTNDLWHPSNEDILGKTWFVLPGGGGYLTWARDPATFGGLAAAVTVFLVLVAPPKKRELEPAPVAIARPQDAWSLAELSVRPTASAGEPARSGAESVVDLTKDRVELAEGRVDRSRHEVGRR